MDFRVSLDIFRGPLDLLLYLVRKHEVEIVDIPIATITDQYLEYLAVLREMDVNSVGDFLAMASTLVELKSQQVLPRADEIDEAIEDPRKELVERLLEYKKYRDAASILEERSRSWQQHYPRVADDLPPGAAIWPRSRFARSSFGTWSASSGGSSATTNRRNRRTSSTTRRRFTSTWQGPSRLRQEEQLSFYDFFEPAMHKSSAIGVFLAILELVRHRRIEVDQEQIFGQIWLRPRHDAEPLDFSKIDNYDYETFLAE